MSKKERGPSLHVEWAPDRVQAIDLAHGRRYSVASLPALAQTAGGHKDILIGVSRQLIFLKVVSLPKAAPEDLRRILGIQLQQLFPLPADQIAFDFVQTAEQTAEGYTTLVAAIRADDLRQINSEVKAAGFTSARILPIALGAMAVAERAHLKDALIVEAPETGGGYTFDVVSGGIVRLSRTSLEGADLTQEAQRTLAAAGVVDASLLVAGDAEALRAFTQSIDNAATPMPGIVTQKATALELLHEGPHFAFELAEERVRAIQKQVQQQNRVAVLMFVAALLMVAIVWKRWSDQEAVASNARGKVTAAQIKLRSIRDAEQSADTKATAMQTALHNAFSPPQRIGDILEAAGDSLPQSAWLTGINVERGKPVQVRGTVSDPDDVARYLKALEMTGRFRNVQLVVANSGKIRETPVVEFNISATAIGNLPMPEPDKKKSTGTHSTGTSASPAPGAK